MSTTNLPDPRFLIHVAGTRLPVEREAEVIEINVNDRLDAPSAFSIKISDQKHEWIDNDDYFVGAEIKISLGYEEELEELIEGEIVGVDVHFKAQIGTIVTLRGKNRLHRLDRKKSTCSFTGKTESEVVEELAGQAGLTADVVNAGRSSNFILQKDMTPLEYILDFARRYDCFLKVKGKTDFICKPIPRNAAEDFVLEKGKTLLTFNSTIDSSGLYSEVEVLGWDYKMTNKINGAAGASDIDSDPGEVVDQAFGGARQTIIDLQVADINAADKLAQAMLARNGREYKKAVGSCRGDNRITAGSIIMIKAVGETFEGKYLVNTVSHSLIPDKGYKTEFYMTNFVSSENSGDPNETEPLTEEEKNPTITNLQWKNMDNQVITEALVGDMVLMCADVTDISDGQSVKITLYEKDSSENDEESEQTGENSGSDQENGENRTGNTSQAGQNSSGSSEEGSEDSEDDEIDSFSATVKDKKIEFSWEVIYTEDTDDTESDAEMQQKGYTLPEYVFKIEYAAKEIDTGKGPLLEIIDWRELQLLDEEGEPMANEKYTLYDYEDNEIESGNLDEEGFIRIEGIHVSKCYITFPELTEDEEEGASGGEQETGPDQKEQT